MNQQQFAKKFEALTARRREVLLRILAGDTDEEIASALQITESTVRKHIELICKSFRVEPHPGERSKRPDLIKLFRQYRPDLVKVDETQEVKETQKTVFKDIPLDQDVNLVERENTMQTLYYEDQWVGREDLIKYLITKLQGTCRVLILTGITGIGKTALAERLKKELEGSLLKFFGVNFDNPENTDFCSVAVELLHSWGETITPEDCIEPQRLLSRVVNYLQNNRYLLIIDSLELILKWNIDQGWSEFTDNLWDKFFHSLLSIKSCESRVILTSQDLPGPLEAIGSRYQELWENKPLKGFTKAEQLEFFKKMGLEVDTELPARNHLIRIGAAYEGHPLALRVIIGEIINDFKGNILAYWKRYGHEVEEVEQICHKSELESSDDRLRLDRYNRRLQRAVKQRIEKTFERLAKDVPDAYLLLCFCSVYRRPVSENFYLNTLGSLGLDEERQQAALNGLLDRYLIEEDIVNDTWLLRQHNLIRSVALNHLKNWRNRS